MELDDLKQCWDNQTGNAQQQKLTAQIIDHVVQRKYSSKINKIAYPELIGTCVCLIAALFIGINFYRLNTVFLQGVGAVAMLLLLAVSILSLSSLRKLKMTKDFNKPYAETLRMFAMQKIAFYKLQKLNVMLCYLLLVAVVILLSKFFGNKDITNSKYFWTFAFSIGYLFLLFVSMFVSKFYTTTLKRAEALLLDLQA